MAHAQGAVSVEYAKMGHDGTYPGQSGPHPYATAPPAGAYPPPGPGYAPGYSAPPMAAGFAPNPAYATAPGHMPMAVVSPGGMPVQVMTTEQAIMSLPGLYIKQRIELLEVVTGWCGARRRLAVLPITPDLLAPSASTARPGTSTTCSAWTATASR